MQINNLTRPPVEQEEIELNIFYDTDAQLNDFTDSFCRLHWRHRETPIYEYIDYGNLPDTFDLVSDFYDLTKVTHKEARNALWQHEEAKASEDWKKIHSERERMRDFFQQYNYSWERAFDWKDALVDTLDQDYTIKEAANDEVDLIDYCENHGNNFHVFSTSGHSQGDYALVIVNIKEMEKLSGRDFDDKFKQVLLKIIHNLFWDCPVYARLEIDGDEFFLQEYLSDSYVYDKEEIIEGARNDKNYDYPEYVIKFLEDNLTDYLDY